MVHDKVCSDGGSAAAIASDWALGWSRYTRHAFCHSNAAQYQATPELFRLLTMAAAAVVGDAAAAAAALLAACSKGTDSGIIMCRTYVWLPAVIAVGVVCCCVCAA